MCRIFCHERCEHFALSLLYFYAVFFALVRYREQYDAKNIIVGKSSQVCVSRIVNDRGGISKAVHIWICTT